MEHNTSGEGIWPKHVGDAFGPATNPEGPSTHYFRTLVPKAIKGVVFGTRVLKYLVLGASG